jgi:cation-transporting P-type ATPase C
VPGRRRWKVDILRNRPRKAAAVAMALQQTPGILAVEATPLTARLLVRYDPSLSGPEVEAAVYAALATPPLSLDAYRTWCRDHTVPSHAHTHTAHTHDASGPHTHEGDELSGYVRNLWLGGTVLAGLLGKRLFLGAGFLAGNPVVLALTTVTTLLLGIPFFWGALRAWSTRSGMTTDTLVSSATLASLVLRESATGLTVNWLLNLGEYLQTLTLQRTRQAIRALLPVGTEEVWVVQGTTETRQLLAAVRPGDLVAVYAGSISR